MTTYTGTSGDDNYLAANNEDAFYLLGGNDRLTVWRQSGSVLIDAGDGNDIVQVAGSASPIRFTGLVYKEQTASFTITTGPGQDTVQPFAYRVTITDFDPASDKIDLQLRDQLFAAREAYQIVADGPDTVILHLGGLEQIRLLNVAPSSLNATNIINASPITADVTGSGAADVLTGSALSEKITGGGGNDSLTGGGGNDVFFYASRNDGVDQIHDFKSGEDWIGLDAAGFGLTPGDPGGPGFSGTGTQALFFSGQLNGPQFSAPTVVYDPTSYTITWVQSSTADASGRVTYDASVLARLDPGSTFSYAGSQDFGVQPTSWVLSGTGEFGGASIVWREPGTGHTEFWSGGQHFDLGFNKGPAWSLAAVGDFNGDNTSDILWRNVATSQVDEWKIGNTNWAGSTDLGATKGADWQMAGTGDFNGDGTDDVLWRNTSTGQVDQWQMKNGNWGKSIDLGATKPADWVVGGVGDFNGDGTDDILWRNPSTGQVDEWQMRNGNWSRSIDLGATKGSNWEVAGVGDVNANGTADVLWRDLNTGQTEAWIMKDGNWAGTAAIGTRDTSAQSASVGAALVWHNPTTGQTDTWNFVSTAPTHAYDYLII